MNSVFTLDERLAHDCRVAGDLPLCRLLLFNDRRYPWLILVPRRAGIREIHELSPADRQQLLDESCDLAQALAAAVQPDKLNIAALGNVVPQLHLHHVARFQGDPAWPGPVWGQGSAEPYAAGEAEAMLERLLPRLQQPLVVAK